MLDSFSHRRPGAASGLIVDLGRRDQCELTFMSSVRAKYFLLRASLSPYSMQSSVRQTINHAPHHVTSNTHLVRWIQSKRQLFLAVCLPSTCNQSDVDFLISSRSFVNYTQPVKLSVEKVNEITSPVYERIKGIAKVLIVSIIILNAAGTILAEKSFLNVFNVKENVNFLFRPPTEQVSQFICLIKILVIIAAIFINIFYPLDQYHSLYLTKPLFEAIDSSSHFRWLFLLIHLSLPFVFIISAIISTLDWMSIIKDPQSQVSFVSFLLTRMALVLPSQTFVILLMIMLPDLNLTGSLSQMITTNVSANCFQNGLIDLSFTSNLQPLSKSCNRVNWFISSDFQMLALSSTFLLVPVCFKDTRINIYRCLLVILFIISFLASLPFIELIVNSIVIVKNQHQVFMRDPFSISDTFFNSLFSIPSYIAGLAIGYEISLGSKISRNYRSTAFIASLMLYLITLIIFSMLGSSSSRLLNSIIFLVGNFVHTCCFCCLVYSLWSSSDHWLISSFTCNPVVSSVARTSFIHFILHPVIIVVALVKVDTFFWSFGQMYLMLVPLVFIFTYLLSCIIHVALEQPFNRIVLEYSFVRSKRASSSVECTRL